MIHERTGPASTYFGVDPDYTTMPDGTRRANLSTEPLARTVQRVVPAADPVIGWYWTRTSSGERHIWFLRREHAEAFRQHLIA